MELLLDIYQRNRELLHGKRLSRFLDYLQELGPAFTELQVMQIAGSCRLFPPNTLHYFGDNYDPLPSFQSKVGEFGQATYHGGKLVGWKPLGSSRHVKHTVRRRLHSAGVMLTGFWEM